MPADTTTPKTVPAEDAPQGAGRPAGRQDAWRALLGRWETLILVLLVVLAFVGQGISPEFLTTDSFTTGSLDFSEVALMALPLTLVIVAAENTNGETRRDAWRALLGRWETLILALLVVLAFVGQAISPQFLTTDSFTTGSLDFSEIALMALPVTLVIVAAEIDLSVASVLALSSAVMAWMWDHNQPIEVIIPVCLVVGALCGAFNGLLVTRLGLPSLAVTIGTLALFRGLAFVVIGDDSVTDFPATWTDRAFGNFGGTFIPNTMVLFAILAVAFGVVLHATPFGRSVFAIGANEEAAYFSGIRVKRIKMLLFVASGVVAALAGVVLSLRNSTAAANVGQGFELTVVAAVVLGGVSIFGGRGTILGVILALVLLGGIQKALSLSESISSYWIQIVTGALLVGSVLGPNLVQRAREARAHPSRQRGPWPPRAAAHRTRSQEEKA